MTIIWTFTLLMIPGVLSSISVTGYSGGGVSITCRYERKYTENAKYFCKGQKPVTPQIGWCYDLIKTKEKDKWVDSGRFSLYDDTRAAVFNVTIRNLSEWDSGTHQCGVDIHISEDFYIEVNLKVLTETNYHRTSSSFSSGESPLISSVSPVTGSSLIISVSVPLLLIITVILLVIVTLWRRRQSHNADSASKSSHATNGNSKAILITSAEDLNYAVVNFQKKPDCPESVRLRNNQDYSECTAVNHLTASAENVCNKLIAITDSPGIK